MLATFFFYIEWIFQSIRFNYTFFSNFWCSIFSQFFFHTLICVLFSMLCIYFVLLFRLEYGWLDNYIKFLVNIAFLHRMLIEAVVILTKFLHTSEFVTQLSMKIHQWWIFLHIEVSFLVIWWYKTVNYSPGYQWLISLTHSLNIHELS